MQEELLKLKKENEDLRSLIADIWDGAYENRHNQVSHLIESFINSENA